MCRSLSLSLPPLPLLLIHTFIPHFPLAWASWHPACPPGDLSYFLTHVATVTYGKFQHFLFNIVWPFLVLCNRKKERERWVQTFLVVKGRNLQLSNKSLRLNPFCDWLQRATWRTLYEHELYAVVYSLVLPLYQQQTKLGRRNSFIFYSNVKTLHSRF